MRKIYNVIVATLFFSLPLAQAQTQLQFVKLKLGERFNEYVGQTHSMKKYVSTSFAERLAGYSGETSVPATLDGFQVTDVSKISNDKIKILGTYTVIKNYDSREKSVFYYKALGKQILDEIEITAINYSLDGKVWYCLYPVPVSDCHGF